jgi:hypothetical protein
MEASEADLAKVRPLKKRGKDRGAAAALKELPGPGEQEEEEEEEQEGAEEAAAAHHVLSEAARNSKDAPVGNADVEVPGNEVADVPEEGAAAAGAPAAGAGGKGKGKKRGAVEGAQQQGAATELQPQKKGRKR